MTRSKPNRKTPFEPIQLVNPGTSGVVYDEAGHSVGGGDRATLPGDPDPVAMRQLAAGHLLAQRGSTWLTVRDGRLEEPDIPQDAAPPAEAQTQAPESGPAGEIDSSGASR